MTGRELYLRLLETYHLQMEMAAEAGVKAFVKDYIHVLGSNDRYTFEDKDTGSKE